MRAPYTPASQQYWHGYFATGQSGGGLQGFKGARYQSGAGIGNILARLMRFVLPIAKSVGKNVAKTALATGASIAADVSTGKKLKTAAKERGKIAASNIIKHGAKRVIKKIQTGKGLGQRKSGPLKSIKGSIKPKRIRKSKKKVDALGYY